MLPCAKNFLITGAGKIRMFGFPVHASQLEMCEYDIRRKTKLKNLSSAMENLLPLLRRKGPATLCLIGTGQTSVRGSIRVLLD